MISELLSLIFCIEMKKKKIAVITTILLLASVVFVAYRVYFAPELMFTEHSPCRRYRVDVYLERNPFIVPFDNHRRVVVVLRNRLGVPIGRCYCAFFLGDVDIRWHRDEVRTSLLGSINFRTGRCGNRCCR